jgi:hypothetical protein
MTLGCAGRAWLDVQQNFEDAWDEWSAMQAVVKLEMLLEAEGRGSSFARYSRSA